MSGASVHVNCSPIPHGCPELPLYIGYTYVLTIICGVGVVFNILNIVVFAHKCFKGSPFTFMMGLAMVDLLTCTLAFPAGLMRCLPSTGEDDMLHRQRYGIYVYMPIVNALAACSVWTTLSMSIERYIFISRPLLARRICQPRYAKICIVTLLVGAFAIHVPYFFYIYINQQNKYEETEFGSSPGFKVYVWIRTSLMKYVPILAVAVINVFLLKAVISATKRHKQLVVPSTRLRHRNGGKYHLQIRVTIMLISISVVYLICHLPEPFAHQAIYSSIFGPCSVYSKAFRVYVMVTNNLELFSYAINFIPYCIFNEQFRKCFVRIVVRRSVNSVEDQRISTRDSVKKF